MLKKILIISVFLTFALSLSVFAYDVVGGTVSAESVLNMRKGPSTDDEIIEKLSSGTRVAVLGETEGWYKVAFGGAVGYVSSEYVEVQDIMNVQPGGAKVITSVLNLREKPGTEYEIVQRLSEGTITKIIGINSGWFKVETSGGKTGYVHPDYVEIVPYTVTSKSNSTVSSSGGKAVVNVENISETRKEILEYAASFLGVKYKYGGASPSGFDCSGFTKYVYAHFDISLARSTADQYSSSVKKISRDQLQPGDLIFWSNGKKGVVGHVGIYVGNNEFIHAPSPGGVVEYESMDTSYYAKRVIGYGTVLSN